MRAFQETKKCEVDFCQEEEREKNIYDVESEL